MLICISNTIHLDKFNNVSNLQRFIYRFILLMAIFFFFCFITIIVAFHTYYSSSNEFSFCLLFMYVINNTWYTSHRNGINLMILLRMVHWAVSIEQLIYLNKIYFKCMDILNTLLTNKLNLIRWSMHWFANFSVLHFIVDISHTYIHNIFW